MQACSEGQPRCTAGGKTKYTDKMFQDVRDTFPPQCAVKPASLHSLKHTHQQMTWTGPLSSKRACSQTDTVEVDYVPVCVLCGSVDVRV